MGYRSLDALPCTGFRTSLYSFPYIRLYGFLSVQSTYHPADGLIRHPLYRSLGDRGGGLVAQWISNIVMTEALNDATKANATLAGLAGKYLTFMIGSESYGIPVLKVREIIRLPSITSVPEMPDYIRGVINLRGKIIPVMDLRLRFGFGKVKAADRNCIVVVQVNTAAGSGRSMGLVVDAVEEVAQLAQTDIEATPDFGSQVATDCLMGMGKIKGVVKALLDIDKVICGDMATALSSTPVSPLLPANP